MADLNLDDIAIFVRVVERSGFASAARELRVPTSTVSRAIERLESNAGVRLFQRTTRTVSTTTEGRDLYTSVAPAVSSLLTAARSLEPASRRPKGVLRVTAPLDIGAAFLSDVIVAFKEKHPFVDLDFSLTNHHSNIVNDGFDVAVRATAKLTDSSVVVRKLGDLLLGLYAAPKYLQKYGTPSLVAELADHQCVVFRAKDLQRTWALEGAKGAQAIDVRGRLGGDDFTFVRAIVRAGGGIGLMPQVNCTADEATGQLVRVLPELHARGATLYLLYPSIKNIPARVTAFRDFVIAAFNTWSTGKRGRPRLEPSTKVTSSKDG